MKNNYPIALSLMLIAGVFASCKKDTPEKTYKPEYGIEGFVDGLPVREIQLGYYYGNEVIPLDTVNSDQKGNFLFLLPREIHPGLYRLSLGPGEASKIDFIFDHEDVELKTSRDYLTDSLQFLKSDVNRMYYAYLKKKKDIYYKLGLINPLIFRYPPEDELYIPLTTRFTHLQRELNAFIDSVIDEMPGSYLARLMRVDRKPVIDPLPLEQAQQEVSRLRFFENKDFSDTLFLYSNLIPLKIAEYLSYFRKPGAEKAEQETILLGAVDTLLKNTIGSEKMHRFTLNFLIEGFGQSNYDRMLNHLIDIYKNTYACAIDDESGAMLDEVETLEKILIGKPAPAISSYGIDGDRVNLHGTDSEYTLLLFWASWCPYCDDLIGELSRIYTQEKREIFEIFAVSLDTLRQDWIKYIRKGNSPWIHACEFKGWQSRAAEDYRVRATPALFLLDRQKTIIARPITLGELKNSMREAGILE
jgi:thiol-disulfide isomerase/thioredoxin